MNWEEAQHEVTKFRALLKKTWPALTEDDLQSLGNHRDIFLFRLQQRVGGELRDLEAQFDALMPPERDRGNFGVIFMRALWGQS